MDVKQHPNGQEIGLSVANCTRWLDVDEARKLRADLTLFLARAEKARQERLPYRVERRTGTPWCFVVGPDGKESTDSLYPEEATRMADALNAAYAAGKAAKGDA